MYMRLLMRLNALRALNPQSNTTYVCSFQYPANMDQL